MVKKIKSSLSAKSFQFIALLLVLCGLLIYSSVVLFLPNSYTIVASDRINQELRDLARHSLGDEFHASGRPYSPRFAVITAHPCCSPVGASAC